ncbi:hypothetical protein HG535_0A04450 [Zygotorulaspora mrakii]|uniref:Inositol-1-monophosphatase n=1 Tax=Zygotorulaspora mrakii TaxID=42260 RepID=A0A7H9AW11_ZYGMR|nr:uncharacterized protein HG535_0A04450 [Zygotorulaspora mrakii]QLG70505.1 hypothetical protein HG535_0A04450 [Zygotorulaspora mrakii]
MSSPKSLPLTKEELKDIESTLINIVKGEVNYLIKNRAGAYFDSYNNKANDVDLVTEIDKKVENIIRDALTFKYPAYGFIGEESYVKGESQLGTDKFWCVDPIDGTTNFVHGYPMSCCSIALVENGFPVVGVVSNPSLGQIFHASKGNGAFLNSEAINILPRQLILQKSLVAFEGGAERTEGPDGNFDAKMATLKSLLSDKGAHIHGVRCTGSAALNMCYVSMGLFDAYWECGVNSWDVAAGACILVEAGGILVGGMPQDWRIPLDNRCYLAVRGGSNPEEQRWFVEAFWSHVKGRISY